MRLHGPTDHAVDLDHVDLSDPYLFAHREPHAVWAAMRSTEPVHRHQRPDGVEFWSVTRYDDVCRVLGDDESFTAERGTLLSTLGTGDPAGGKMVVATDPPYHDRLRTPLVRALSGRHLREREPDLRTAVRELITAHGTEEPWDFAATIHTLPMTFAGALLGFPQEDWSTIVQYTTAAIAPADPRVNTANADAELTARDIAINQLAAHHDLFAYVSEHLSAHNPAVDDLISALATVAEGNALSHEEVILNCYSLLLGANVTTPHAASALVQLLCDKPLTFIESLAASRASTTQAVEELLRWSSPVNHSMRHTTRPIRIGNRDIPAGAAVVAWLASANRDETQFETPHEYIPSRSGPRHVAFGHGQHYCLGAAVARLTLRLVVEEIAAQRLMVRAAGAIQHLHSNFAAGVTALPITSAQDPARRDTLYG